MEKSVRGDWLGESPGSHIQGEDGRHPLRLSSNHILRHPFGCLICGYPPICLYPQVSAYVSPRWITRRSHGYEDELLQDTSLLRWSCRVWYCRQVASMHLDHLLDQLKLQSAYQPLSLSCFTSFPRGLAAIHLPPFVDFASQCAQCIQPANKIAVKGQDGGLKSDTLGSEAVCTPKYCMTKRHVEDEGPWQFVALNNGPIGILCSLPSCFRLPPSFAATSPLFSLFRQMIWHIGNLLDRPLPNFVSST